MSVPKQKFYARCTPSLGTVSLWWAQAVENIVNPLNYGKAVFYTRDDRGGEIAETRNKLVSLALAFESPEREVTHIFWVDDDVICTRHCLQKLIRHHRDIASGVYFTKAPDGLSEPLIFPGEGAGTDIFVPDKEYEVWGHGMGLCLIKLEVYKEMDRQLNLPKDKYGHPEWYRTTGRLEDMEIRDKVLMCGGTEDLYFLQKAQQCGFQPFVDCSKFTFGFHYDHKRDKGFPEKQWEQYQKRQAVTWETADGLVKWE